MLALALALALVAVLALRLLRMALVTLVDPPLAPLTLEVADVLSRVFFTWPWHWR